MRIHRYGSMDEYLTRHEDLDTRDRNLDIIDDGKWVMADMFTECARPETAVRRFFRGLAGETAFDGWEECLLESIENGCFSQSDSLMADGTKNPVPSWSYGIEQYDDEWYIYLNVRYKEV